MRVLVVDDEAPARERLRRLVGNHEGVEVVGEAQDGLEALEMCAVLQPDLVLLDVEMPELDGIGVAEALAETSTRIVFVSAYDHYAVKAFDQDAVDYVVKPVTPARLERALSRARPKLTLSLRPERMAFKSGSDFIVLNPNDIVWISADGPLVQVHTASDSRLCDETLSGVETRLARRGFARVHRSSLVNLAWVVGLRREGERRYVVVLGDPARTEVVVSRERVQAVKRQLGRDE